LHLIDYKKFDVYDLLNGKRPEKYEALDTLDDLVMQAMKQGT
jgi:hypothetical protein